MLGAPGGHGLQQFGIGSFIIPGAPPGPPLPFNQYDWPGPRPLLPYRQYQTELQPLGSPQLLLSGICGFQYTGFQTDGFQVCTPAIPLAFSQNFWPQPIRVPARWQFWLTIPPLPLTARPFNKSDWPPPIPPYRVYAEVRSAFIPLLHSVKPPIAQNDWPQPIRPYIVRSDSYGIPGPLIAPPVPPIALEDWPPPIQPYRVYAEFRRADIQLLHSVQPPIVQSDWPQPIRPQIRVYTQFYGTPPNLLSVQQAPFSLADWPIPTRVPPVVYSPAIGASIQLLHSTQPPNRKNDWTMPIPPYLVRADSYPIPEPLLPQPTPPPTTELHMVGPFSSTAVYGHLGHTPVEE